MLKIIRTEIEKRIKENEAKFPEDKGGYWNDEERDAFAIAEEYRRFLLFLDNIS